MTEISEKIGELRATAKAAHTRLDDLDGRISKQLDEMNTQLKELNAHMNKGKGWAAMGLLLAGSMGAGVIKLLSFLTAN